MNGQVDGASDLEPSHTHNYTSDPNFPDTANVSGAVHALAPAPHFILLAVGGDGWELSLCHFAD